MVIRRSTMEEYKARALGDVGRTLYSTTLRNIGHEEYACGDSVRQKRGDKSKRGTTFLLSELETVLLLVCVCLQRRYHKAMLRFPVIGFFVKFTHCQR